MRTSGSTVWLSVLWPTVLVCATSESLPTGSLCFFVLDRNGVPSKARFASTGRRGGSTVIRTSVVSRADKRPSPGHWRARSSPNTVKRRRTVCRQAGSDSAHVHSQALCRFDDGAPSREIKDTAGNLAVSGDVTFTTPATAPISGTECRLDGGGQSDANGNSLTNPRMRRLWHPEQFLFRASLRAMVMCNLPLRDNDDSRRRSGNGNSDTDISDIDFAILLTSGGWASVREGRLEG
jgi:hypothetical protein